MWENLKIVIVIPCGGDIYFLLARWSSSHSSSPTLVLYRSLPFSISLIRDGAAPAVVHAKQNRLHLIFYSLSLPFFADRIVNQAEFSIWIKIVIDCVRFTLIFRIEKKRKEKSKCK